MGENMTLTGFDDTNGALFSLMKAATQKTYTIGFDLRAYLSDQGGDDFGSGDNCPSGAYIFKPSE
jgi:hypothetical protein